MKRLTHLQMRSVLAAVSDLHASHEPQSLPERVFAATKRVVASDHVGLTVWDRDKIKLDNPVEFPIKAMYTEPHITVTPAMAETYNHVFHEEPFREPFYRNGLTTPTRISDIMPDARYYQLGIYNEHFRKIGVDRALAFALAPVDEGVMVSVGMSRAKKEFTDAEVAALAALRPHIIAAHNAAEEIIALRREQGLYKLVLEESERGVIFPDERRRGGRVRHMTRRARHLLTKYFACQAAGVDDRLPEEITRWLARGSGSARHAVGGSDVEASAAIMLEIRRGAEVLRVRKLVSERAEKFLLLDEAGPPAAQQQSAAVETFGLTRRESEILGWVARGKTNAEVAALCDVSARTVQKHLEHIFQKLGVETRTAAALLLVKSDTGPIRT